METELHKTECGACGNDTFHVYSQGKGSDFKFHVECMKCKSTTVITTEPSILKTEWGENSNGVLAWSYGKNTHP